MQIVKNTTILYEPYYTRLNDRSDNYEQIRAYSHYGIV